MNYGHGTEYWLPPTDKDSASSVQRTVFIGVHMCFAVKMDPDMAAKYSEDSPISTVGSSHMLPGLGRRWGKVGT